MWITCANQNKTNWWLIQQTSVVRDCAGREGTELNGRVSGSSSTQSGEHRQHFLWKQSWSATQDTRHKLPLQITAPTHAAPLFSTPPPLQTLSTLKARKEPYSSISSANGKEPGSRMILHKLSGEWMRAALAMGLRSGMQMGTVPKGSEDPELLNGVFCLSPSIDGVDTVEWEALAPLCGPMGGSGSNGSVSPREGQIKASAKLRARFGLKNPVNLTYFY